MDQRIKISGFYKIQTYAMWKKKKVIKKKVQKSVYKHATSFIKGECIHLYVYIYIEQLLKAQETGNLTLG